MMSLQQRNRWRAVEVGIMGLGYVGLAEAMALAKAGRRVTGFDLDSTRIHNCHEPEVSRLGVDGREVPSVTLND